MSDGCQHICRHGGISPSTDVKRMRANWGAQYNQGACGVCIYIYSTHTHGPQGSREASGYIEPRISEQSTRK